MWTWTSKLSVIHNHRRWGHQMTVLYYGKNWLLYVNVNYYTRVCDTIIIKGIANITVCNSFKRVGYLRDPSCFTKVSAVGPRRWWLSIVTVEGPSTHQKTWYLVWRYKKRVLAGDTAVPSPAITHLVPHCTKCHHISPLLFYHWFISRRQWSSPPPPSTDLWFHLFPSAYITCLK